MYVAKSRKLGVRRVRGGDDQHSVERLALAGDLRHAIASKQLVLFYQPVVDVVTGELVGAEALVRWQHPERGLIPPDEFIPTAETTGAIRALTSEALEMAVRQAVRWRESGLDIPVSVNVSVQDVLDDALPGEIAALLIRYGLPAEALKIELTESMLMADPQRAHDVLSALDDMGVRIAIDDFGTGYSSLAYLARLPVEQLKVDRGIIRDLDERNNAVIVASIIELARQLGLRTVAEGVERSKPRRRWPTSAATSPRAICSAARSPRPSSSTGRARGGGPSGDGSRPAPRARLSPEATGARHPLVGSDSLDLRSRAGARRPRRATARPDARTAASGRSRPAPRASRAADGRTCGTPCR